MSSRALRKLQKKNNLDELSLLEDKLNAKSLTDTTADSKKGKISHKQPANLFSMFGDEKSESESSEEEEKGEDEEEQYGNQSDDGNEKSQAALNSSFSNVTSKTAKTSKNKNSKSNDVEGDVDFDKLVDQFQKENMQKYYAGINQEGEGTLDAADSNVYSIKNDPGFTKFRKHSDIQALFSSIKTSFLDPQTELKSLFDDIPLSVMNETSDSSGLSQHQQQQLKRMKRLVKNWATGKNKRTVPNGPSLTKTLLFSNIRDDWIPTQRGELHMKVLNDQDFLDWNAYLRPNDWLDVIKEDISVQQKNAPKIKYFKFEPLSREQTSKNMVEFYLSVVLHPDHESLISLIQSQAPYFVPGLLQVATILVRQGDRSNSNGLVERALFVFDRALKNGLTFNGIDAQLPYIFFFNRQFYLAIFQYIGILEQRGCIGSASNWCKVLWSLSPCEDPLGCRFFIDHYLLQAQDYKFLVDLSRNKLFTQYKEWQTFNLDISIVLAFLKMDLHEQAAGHMKAAFQRHPYAVKEFYLQGLHGNPSALPKNIQKLQLSSVAEDIQLSFYLLRMSKYWSDLDITKMTEILDEIWRAGVSNETFENTLDSKDAIQNERLYLEGLEINLLRFTLLSQESSIMHKLPTKIFEKYQIFDYDVLPPPFNESLEKIDALPLETIHDFINKKDLEGKSSHLLQDQNLLDLIQRVSLQDYIQDNTEQPDE